MLKFYMTPGSCSTGIHILLEELDLLFEVYVMNMLKGELQTPEYLAINPKGTIPTLVLDDGQALISFQSIAWWLAKTYPDRNLLPHGIMAEAKALELLNYAVNNLHGEGFTRIFTTDKYTQDPDQQVLVKSQGEAMVNTQFELISKLFSGDCYLFDEFSICDVALFYNEFWANRLGIEMPERCQKHYETMLGRSKVRSVLMEEGYGASLA